MPIAKWSYRHKGALITRTIKRNKWSKGIRWSYHLLSGPSKSKQKAKWILLTSISLDDIVDSRRQEKVVSVVWRVKYLLKHQTFAHLTFSPCRHTLHVPILPLFHNLVFFSFFLLFFSFCCIAFPPKTYSNNSFSSIGFFSAKYPISLPKPRSQVH